MTVFSVALIAPNNPARSPYFDATTVGTSLWMARQKAVPKSNLKGGKYLLRLSWTEAGKAMGLDYEFRIGK